MILPAIERNVHRNIESEARKAKCTVIALNGTMDHVHSLLGLATTISLADLVKQLKGVSAHFVNETLKPDFHFRWQGSYGAFSVSEADLPRVIDYIKRQKEHHAVNTLWAYLETTCIEVPVLAVAA